MILPWLIRPVKRHPLALGRCPVSKERILWVMNSGPWSLQPSGLPSSGCPSGERVCPPQLTAPQCDDADPPSLNLDPPPRSLPLPLQQLLLGLLCFLLPLCCSQWSWGLRAPPQVQQPNWPSSPPLCTRPRIFLRSSLASQQSPSSWMSLVYGSDYSSVPWPWNHLQGHRQCPSLGNSSMKGSLT